MRVSLTAPRPALVLRRARRPLPADARISPAFLWLVGPERGLSEENAPAAKDGWVGGSNASRAPSQKSLPLLQNIAREVIRRTVPLYVKYPLSLRNVEDLLFARGIDLCHGTVRYWWNRFGPMLAGEIKRKRVSQMRGFRHWRWHVDEIYVKVKGTHYPWRAVDHEVKCWRLRYENRDKAAALAFLKSSLERHGSPEAITQTDFVLTVPR